MSAVAKTMRVLIKKEPKEIGEFENTLHPRDYRVFAGVIDLDHWPAWGRLLFKALGGRAGDNRHWPEIDAWAEQIARALRARSESVRGAEGLGQLRTSSTDGYSSRSASTGATAADQEQGHVTGTRG